MHEILVSIAAIIIAYLLGSIPSAFIIGKKRGGMDIRQVGSRNMGAMNTFYSVGFWWGMLVLGLDILKGSLGVLTARWLGTPQYIDMACGLAVLLGHNLPVFLNFKGGKGGASLIGVLIVFMPWGILIYPLVFGLILIFTRFPTLSYGAAFFCFPFIAGFIYHSIPFIIYSLALVLIPMLRYIPRIKEMRKGSGTGGWKHVALRKNLKDRL
jgi:acyl phosphate:glycerol-3-phosphate acyltransferase